MTAIRPDAGQDAGGVRRALQRFAVSYEYPVIFGRNLLHPACPALAEAIARLDPAACNRVMVCLDDGLVRAQPDLPRRILAYAAAWPRQIAVAGAVEYVPGGEAAKASRGAVEDLAQGIAQRRLCRQSVVLAVGGGSALDVVGFAAALVHRGVRLVRLPTTVLSQADSGVGVKNGIDAFGMKNAVGTFAPPFAVLTDTDFLATLAWPYWIGGVSEAFKVAMIRDRGFFDELCAAAPRLRRRDEAAMAGIVERAARLHLDHIRVAGDAFELGAARPLDFGHWSAHRLEMSSGYAIGHGQAVAIGIALDTAYACRCGLIAPDARDTVLAALTACGLPIWSDLLARRGDDGALDILKGIADFREHLGGRLTVTFPGPIGRGVEVHAIDADGMADCIAWLGRRAEPAA
jgi:3-dehydroquinate synthase